jgi:SnoaL-like domain
MSTTSTRQTAETARACFQGWTTGDWEAVASALAEDFTFESAMITFTGRDEMLSAMQWPQCATTVLVAEAYEDDHGFQLYDATNAGNTVRIAEHMVVRDGRLVHSTVVCDGAAFMAFMAPAADGPHPRT